ncbi:Zinc finger CCHC domain-containing protein 4 [Orchesella cincta]|uniref:Zinc finger CCHC domain-containing protein 4 n=1 Tax=Orchesella cincta TaxID=48709 RepID=A0A1D2M479_ORCCI|nr:Zinc finger CCHC domain-containing protein 4 [Orchesella cincta]
MRKINHPLSFPNQRDKGEAQYHFNDQTVHFFMDQFSRLKFDSVLCVGTPSLHQHITDSSQGLKSFLLDIDDRFVKLHQQGFALYNMCNHHFFRNHHHPSIRNSSQKLENWQSSSTLRWRQSGAHLAWMSLWNPFGLWKIFWIFPYFMEGHILSSCPSSGLEMSDFHVEYRNHAKYSGGTRSKSSPIRVFTTVPLSKLVLSEEDYRYCDICSKWVDKLNLHCDSCETCTTKDGGKSYVHCYKCEKCVKPSWKHCSRCQICHLADSPEKCVAKGAESKTGYPKSSKKQRHSFKKS